MTTKSTGIDEELFWRMKRIEQENEQLKEENDRAWKVCEKEVERREEAISAVMKCAETFLENTELKKQNDALLKACKGAELILDYFKDRHSDVGYALMDVRAAIELCEKNK